MFKFIQSEKHIVIFHKMEDHNHAQMAELYEQATGLKIINAGFAVIEQSTNEIVTFGKSVSMQLTNAPAVCTAEQLVAWTDPVLMRVNPRMENWGHFSRFCNDGEVLIRMAEIHGVQGILGKPELIKTEGPADDGDYMFYPSHPQAKPLSVRYLM